jgi:hypothetical protein
MKSNIGFLGIFVFLVLVIAAKAGDISGKWIVTAENADVEMTFKVDGNVLTGTVYNPLWGEMKIKEGKIDGNSFSFIVVRKVGQNDTRIFWKGTVDGEVMKVDRVIGGVGSRQLIGMRPKEKSK